jgi:hypothetical protein
VSHFFHDFSFSQTPLLYAYLSLFSPQRIKHADVSMSQIRISSHLHNFSFFLSSVSHLVSLFLLFYICLSQCLVHRNCKRTNPKSSSFNTYVLLKLLLPLLLLLLLLLLPPLLRLLLLKFVEYPKNIYVDPQNIKSDRKLLIRLRQNMQTARHENDINMVHLFLRYMA